VRDKLLFLWCPVIDNNLRGANILGASLPENAKQNWLLKRHACIFKKSDRTKTHKRRMCQATSVMQCSLFWISLPLKMGLD
jgi:hypothetical protein